MQYTKSLKTNSPQSCINLIEKNVQIIIADTYPWGIEKSMRCGLFVARNQCHHQLRLERSYDINSKLKLLFALQIVPGLFIL